MTDTRKVQLASEMDATGAKTGFDQVKQAARDMAREVAQQGQAASKAVDGIGDGAKGAADKVDRDTRSIIGSIQRTTAAMQAGERGSAGYFEALAKQRGVSVDALRPYLADLQRAQEAQRAASASLDGMGMSARATAAAMRGVPAQFNDIIVSLQGGQKPLTVLMQQGGQLATMFGGVGNAARAMGTYVAGLVGPFTLAAVAATGLGAAYLAGSAEAGKLQRALIESGNAAGTTAGQMAAMAAEINRMGQGTTGKAVEVLAALAATGRVGAENMQRFAAAAIAMEKAGGQAADETVKAFAELGKAPLQGTLKLNEAMNYLTVGTYRQIKSLEDQGRTVDAARVSQDAYADAIEKRTPQMVASLGTLERAWAAINRVSGEAIDATLKVGRSDDALTKQIKAIETQIGQNNLERQTAGAYGQAAIDRGNEKLKARLTILQQAAGYEALSSALERERTLQVRAQVEWDKEAEKYLDKRQQMEREITKTRNLGAAAGRSQVEIEKQVQAIREKYTEKKTGTPGDAFAAERDAAKEWAKYYRDFGNAIDEANGKAGQLSKSQVDLVRFLESPAYGKMSEPARQLALQQAYAAIEAERNAEATKASAKAAAEAADGYARYIDGLNRSAEAVGAHLQTVRDEVEAEKIAATGRLTLKAAIEEVTIARMRERQEALLASGDLNAVVAIEREIQLRTQLRDELQAKETADANRKAATEFAKEWQSEVKDLGKSLTDALFDGGKSGVQRLQDWLRTVLLRVPVQAAMQSVAGSLLSIGGVNQAAAASATGNTLGGIGSGIGALGSLSTVGSYLATGFMNTIAGTGLGSGLSAASALAANGSIAGGIGMGLGAVAPYALAAMAVYNLVIKDKSAKLGYGASALDSAGGITDAGRLFGFGRGTDVGAQSSLVAISRAVLGGISQQATALGGSATGLAVQAATDIDRKGLGAGTIQVLLNGLRLGGVQTGGTNPLQTAASKISANDLGTWFAENTNQAIIAGLQASSLPKRFADYFDGLVPATMTAAQAAAALELASSVQALGKTFGSLSGALGQLDDISVTAADSLFKLFGGAQQFTSTVSAYIQAFYSDAERATITRKQIEAQLNPVGLALPSTREAFRALVDAQDLTTESGRSAYAALMQVSGAFAELTQSASDAAAELASTTQTIRDEIDRLRGATTTSSPYSAAQLQAQYIAATASARAGSTTAMASLAGLSQSIEEAVTARASTAADVARVRAWLAGSLEQTISSGGTSSTPVAPLPGTVSASALTGGNDQMLRSLQALTDRISALEDPVRASALASARFARLLDRVTPDGEAIAVRVITD